MSHSGSLLERLASRLFVRARIALIALAPVGGFLIIGAAYVSGEREVAAAFDSVRQSAALSAASRDFKSALAEMRVNAKDYAGQPRLDYMKAFEEAHALARDKIASIEALNGVGQDEVVEITTALDKLKADFAVLVKAQELSIASAIEEQNAAVVSIASNVAQASDDAKAGASAMRSVEGAALGSRATASDVAGLAAALGGEAERLDAAIRRFLDGVRAA